ncbi:uncharacterized protein A1O9_06262 [Exophiala aquamarina CBS 119918]|uniref:Succinate dehydrogenase assembly factor 4, mitochondrial n=1 Tax=Exophiala aquamarina CBS 119918 TaxID=1182545 RepID=A0A072PER9_9EURO|nr:uncharacterized protein A1O9_06262 [Exophiala aquamarina CBS 119918]KEF58336.1 hypothetical protein A1O9_06262 [Exophiala aquamarina CBS 119918]
MNPQVRPLRLMSAAPRAHLFTSSCRYHIRRRAFGTGAPLKNSDDSDHSKRPPSSGGSFESFGSFRSGPAPPLLPKEEQDIFDSLQRASTGAFSTPRAPPRINQSPHSSLGETEDAQGVVEARTEKIATEGGNKAADGDQPIFKDKYDRVIEARGKGGELHPDVVRRAQPEFEGDVNPRTGEVGGPKNEPLRWGPTSEWTYNGRATDF